MQHNYSFIHFDESNISQNKITRRSWCKTYKPNYYQKNYNAKR